MPTPHYAWSDVDTETPLAFNPLYQLQVAKNEIDASLFAVEGGAGGGISNAAAVNVIPRTIDGSGNLGDSAITDDENDIKIGNPDSGTGIWIANYLPTDGHINLIGDTGVQGTFAADGQVVFTALTSNGFVKTSAGTGLLVVDTNTYATQAYADALVTGLLDDRGNYNASGNTFPASGGSGAAGAILKGDLWTISVAGTLGGHPVTAGDVVRALVDTPGQTDANWAISENNFGYVALNQALADGKIYVGNASGIGTAVTPSGDLTMSNAGAFSIAAQNSAFWRGKVTDETGSGLWVFNDSPTLITPVLGVASGTSLNLSGNLTVGGNVASHLIADATDTRDIGSPTILWRKGYLSELDAVLFAQNTISVIGGWLIVTKDEGTVDEDVDTSETQIDFGANNIVTNDFIVFRAAGAVEYMQATSLVSGTVWNVTRNVDGSGANAWPQGSVWVNFGYNGTGRIELNANATPRLSMIRQGTSYNTQTEMLRVGDLNGWSADYSAETYGFAVGVPTGSWIKIDATNGVRLGFNATTNVQIDASGNASFTGAVTAASGAIGGFSIGADYIRDAANSFGLASTVTGGDDVRFWAGDTFANRATAPFRVTEAGVVTANSGLIGGWTVNSTAIQNSGGTVKLRGAGNLAFGTTPPTSATVGTGLFLDSTGLYGLASDVVQAIFSASTGKITAGAGNVVLDAQGVSITPGTTSPNKVSWVGANLGTAYLSVDAATTPSMYLWLQSTGNNGSTVKVIAEDGTTDHSAIMTLTTEHGNNRAYGVFSGLVFTGLTIGALAAPNAMLDVRGNISTTGNLLLPEGGVINFDNGDLTLTQTGDLLTLAGGDLAFGDNLRMNGATAQTWTDGKALYGPNSGFFVGNAGDVHFTSNCRVDSSAANGWRYVTTGPAVDLYLYNGNCVVRKVASGSAGANLDWSTGSSVTLI